MHYSSYVLLAPPAAPGRRGRRPAAGRPSSRRKYHGRFPEFRRVSFGRDPGTLKSDIVSKNINN